MAPRIMTVDDLLRRINNRAARLAKLQELDAPKIITGSEAAMLQEAVAALIEQRDIRPMVEAKLNEQFKASKEGKDQEALAQEADMYECEDPHDPLTGWKE